MVRPLLGCVLGHPRSRFPFKCRMNGNDARDERETGSRATTDSDLSARLRQLETQLDRKRDAAPDREKRLEGSSSDYTALGRAFRMSTEFVAGVIAGGGLGWLFDRLLGTSPWGLIVFLLLGFAAGTFNVVRAAGAATSAPSADRALGGEPPEH
jgi:ATP synthase protein I